MKTLALLALALAAALPASAKTRLSVTSFRNAASGQSRCYYHGFGGALGSGMAEQLESELMASGRFDLLDRAHARSAHYAVKGAVTTFELCESGGGAKAEVGRALLGKKSPLSGLGLGGGATSAKVGLDVQVVDQATGQVALAFTTEGTASSAGLDVSVALKGARFGGAGFKNTPLGDATRQAVRDAAERIAKELPERADEPAAASAPARPRAGRAPEEAEAESDVVCATKSMGAAYVRCKPFEASASGDTLKAVELGRGTEVAVEAAKVRRLKPLEGALKPGFKVLASCQDAPACFAASHRGRWLLVCRVLDTFTDAAMVQCGPRQYKVPLARLRVTGTFDAKTELAAAPAAPAAE